MKKLSEGEAQELLEMGKRIVNDLKGVQPLTEEELIVIEKRIDELKIKAKK